MQIFKAIVEALFITPKNTSLKTSTIVDKILVNHEGIIDDKHFGFTRQTKGFREKEVYGIPSFDITNGKVEFENWRQWSAVSIEEIILIAKALNLKEVEPVKLAQLLGANILISGIPYFTKLTPTSILHFSSGVMLKIEAENFPCVTPGIEISKIYPEVKAQHFPKAAWGLRGLVGRVSAAGEIKKGDEAIVYIKKVEG